jgi:hypothetical protein
MVHACCSTYMAWMSETVPTLLEGVRFREKRSRENLGEQ